MGGSRRNCSWMISWRGSRWNGRGNPARSARDGIDQSEREGPSRVFAGRYVLSQFDWLPMRGALIGGFPGGAAHRAVFPGDSAARLEQAFQRHQHGGVVALE